jgi:transcriptional regulator with XRE-family HTH domain
VGRGVHQHELARAVGISLTSLKRLERGALRNAPLWWYRNCAIALGVELDEILDERELQWRPRQNAQQPPAQNWPQRN